jgi:hypothetical protein
MLGGGLGEPVRAYADRAVDDLNPLRVLELFRAIPEAVSFYRRAGQGGRGQQEGSMPVGWPRRWPGGLQGIRGQRVWALYAGGSRLRSDWEIGKCHL